MEKLYGKVFEPLESMDFSGAATAHPTCSNALVEDLFEGQEPQSD